MTRNLFLLILLLVAAVAAYRSVVFVDEAETVVVPMAKTTGSLAPANGCAVLACDETAKVELVMDADDTGLVTVVGSATVECVF